MNNDFDLGVLYPNRQLRVIQRAHFGGPRMTPRQKFILWIIAIITIAGLWVWTVQKWENNEANNRNQSFINHAFGNH